jgi:WD40 repeat protein
VLIFKPHNGSVYAAVFSPDGRYLATSGYDGKVKVTDTGSLQVVRTVPGSTFWCPLAFSPDGKFLARGGDGVAVWAWADSSTSPVFTAEKIAFKALAFSPNGHTLAGQGVLALRRWAIPSGKRQTGTWGCQAKNNAFPRPTGCLAYAPDGSVLATSYWARADSGPQPGALASVVFLWNARTGSVRGRLVCEVEYTPTAIAFSRDGSLLAGVCGPAMIVFDVATRERLAVVKRGPKHFKGLAFTPDGRLVTVSNDQTVRVWEARKLTEVHAYEWKIGRLGAVAVASGGQRLAAAGDTGRVVIWDADD